MLMIMIAPLTMMTMMAILLWEITIGMERTTMMEMEGTWGTKQLQNMKGLPTMVMVVGGPWGKVDQLVEIDSSKDTKVQTLEIQQELAPLQQIK